MEVGFEMSYVQATPSVSIHSLVPSDHDVELSAPSPAPCLPAAVMFLHDDNELNPEL